VFRLGRAVQLAARSGRVVLLRSLGGKHLSARREQVASALMTRAPVGHTHADVPCSDINHQVYHHYRILIHVRLHAAVASHHVLTARPSPAKMINSIQHSSLACHCCRVTGSLVP